MEIQVHKKELIHRGKVFDLYGENITLPNGHTTTLSILRHPGASAMVALTEDLKVLLIRQYRHAAGGYIWEIPAGTLDPEESPLDCAQRELVEETGFSADAWHKLGEIIPVPGYSDERIHIFLARTLKQAEQNLDSDEVLEVHPFALPEVVGMITAGQIMDAKTISGIFLAKCHLHF
jgi:ADP-ribose pyrophosphatase